MRDNDIDRKTEIVNACEELYKSTGFKEITIKDISEKTTFSRPSIYNYFETKEEIFLALLKKEYVLWIQDLEKMITTYESLNKDDFAKELSKTIANRNNMLKLLAMNLYDIEENSSLNALVDFKQVYGNSINTVKSCLSKFIPTMTIKEQEEFIYELYPFMYGIYPYTSITQKQKVAMEIAKIKTSNVTVYDITYRALKKMLNI